MNAAVTALRSGILPYVQIARPDHWFKNVFVLPGVLLLVYANPAMLGPTLLGNVGLALIAVCLIASSYYVLNEILDAPFDALHPVKRERPIPSGRVVLSIAYFEWAVLALAGLGLASLLGTRFLACALALWVMSLVYNVPPTRAKDRTYIDVLVESVNNPLRLALGWFATGTTLVLPISMVMAFWMLGGFFMTVKRLAEYRLIGDPAKATAYRASFAGYSEDRLLVAATYYAVAFGLFLGIFIIRYRMELLVTIPFVAGAIAWYIHLGFKPESPAQYPERLYKEYAFMAYVGLCLIAGAAALYIEMPWLRYIFEPTGALIEAGRE